jgi:hypothetical protein
MGDRHCSTALVSLPFFLKLVAEDRQLLVLRATSGERRNVHTRLQATESVARNLERCEKNCDSCEEENELVLGKRSAKLPFLNAGGEERTASRGQSADRGHALEAPTVFFPAPIHPIFP